MENVRTVLLLSGKRKSGKDYIAERLYSRIGFEKCEIIRISEPIKAEWAKKLNLNLKELLNDGPYKEIYRKDMIQWSDEVRSEDYGFFCREAVSKVSKETVIVSDIRRKTDIKYFKEIFQQKVKTIRIICSEEERIRRGWIYQDCVDNVQSECDLDDYTEWDMEIYNENQTIENIIEKLISNFSLFVPDNKKS